MKLWVTKRYSLYADNGHQTASSLQNKIYTRSIQMLLRMKGIELGRSQVDRIHAPMTETSAKTTFLKITNTFNSNHPSVITIRCYDTNTCIKHKITFIDAL